MQTRIVAICLALVSLPQISLAAAPLHEPLSLDVAASVEKLGLYDLSPDGRWLAYTYYLEAAEGRHGLRVVEIKTGKQFELGTKSAAYGAPSWSPDSRLLAYQTDEYGEAALAVWDRSSSKKLPVPLAMVPALQEPIRWFQDSRRMLLVLRPKGEILQSSDFLAQFRRRASSPFRSGQPGSPAVFVLHGNMGSSDEPDEATCGRPFGRCDLGIVDLDTLAISRLLVRARLGSSFIASPDAQRVAYTLRDPTLRDPTLRDPGLQRFSLNVLKIETRKSYRVDSEVALPNGAAISWSPTSRQLAYIVTSGSANVVRLTDITDDASTESSPEKSVVKFSFHAGVGEAPLWNRTGTHVYMLSSTGDLWTIDAARGIAAISQRFPNCASIRLLSQGDRNILAARDDRIWVSCVAPDYEESSILRLNLLTGRSVRVWSGRYVPLAVNVVPVASDDGLSLVFTMTSQQCPDELWALDARSGHVRALTALHAKLAAYALGKSRLIRWKTRDGRDLRGALLLPPWYRDGMRLPLVVSVYGGAMGSLSVNLFALDSRNAALFNAHVLATRGYAILYPDIPLPRLGYTSEDIFDAVMPGVDAAIAEGIVDPGRLALTGSSYGSYTVLAIITRTNRFQAAEMSAVLHPDLIAGYLSTDAGGRASTVWYERDLWRLGGSPWEEPESYRRNSTVYDFDRISTPVLMAAGELDFAHPGPGAAFTALRRVGVPVEYRLYEGDGHIIARQANVVDYWERRLDFFAEHLNLMLDEQGVILFDGNIARPARVDP